MRGRPSQEPTTRGDGLFTGKTGAKRSKHAMAYRLDRSDGNVQKGVQRIAAEQMDRAISEIDDREHTTDETIHQIRKRCKKLRGLIRLVRPAFQDYRTENAVFRDAAGELSRIRDTASTLQTYDAVADHFQDQIDRTAFAQIRRRLTLHAKSVHREVEIGEKLEAFRDVMEKERAGIEAWTLDKGGYGAVAGGLRKTYKRARKAMAAAFDTPTAEAMHEWRKRVKYHWYHSRLLNGIAPDMMAPHTKAASELSDSLGDHHDLAVLLDRIQAAPADYGDPRDVKAFAALIRQRQDELAQRSFELGGVLFAERPKALVKRWGKYWALWQEKDEGKAVPGVAA